MIPLVMAVFLASLLGGLHCAGMCGPFVAFAVATPTIEGRPIGGRAVLHAAYNAGRLLTYTVLGAVGGALGGAVDLGANAVGVQRAAAMLAGAMIVFFGVAAVLRVWGVRVPSGAVPSRLRTLALVAHRRASLLRPSPRAFATGLLTTLLPCGWLYAFAITAAGTGSPSAGALVMAAFWTGTLPVMLSLGVGLQRLAGPLRTRMPAITALLLVLVGIYTIFGRLSIPPVSRDAHRIRSTALDEPRVPVPGEVACPLCHPGP